MAEAALDTIGAALTRWTVGSAAAPAATLWRAELGADPVEAELRLLALAGHFLDLAVTAEPPAELRTLPDLPILALPTVPDAIRSLARRLVATKERQPKIELLRFLATRGWTMHPGDCLPTTSDDDLPDVYAPWRDWVDAAASAEATRHNATDRLSAANWEDYWPAARKAALAQLRQRDPAAARALLEQKFANEGADARLRLLTLLTTRLSEADAAFLEGIAANDRAPKVKALAASLLARLGRGSAAGEEAGELAAFFSLQTKGWLRRTRMIEVGKASVPAQRLRRAALFETVDLVAFARALGLSPEELVAAWSWDVDGQADHGLILQVARTGTDDIVALVADNLAQSEASNLHGFAVLAPRLTVDNRRKLATQLLRRPGFSFEAAKHIAGVAARLDDPLEASAGTALVEALRRADARPSDQASELNALGLITSRTGAHLALQRLIGAGLLQGDPRLDMLRLNAALDDNGAQE